MCLQTIQLADNTVNAAGKACCKGKVQNLKKANQRHFSKGKFHLYPKKVFPLTGSRNQNLTVDLLKFDTLHNVKP
jgi:hypothetical protein